MNDKYAALIVDIKKSRELTLDSRVECQEKLIQIVGLLNDMFSGRIVKKLVFSSGDSVQGLFNGVEEALMAYYMMKHMLYPYEIRGGIGYGHIIEKISDENSNISDGIAYHRASEALENSKKTSYDIILYSEDSKHDVMINQSLHTAMMIEKMQTNKQRDMNNLFNLLSPITFGTYKHINKYIEMILKLIDTNVLSYKILMTADITLKIKNSVFNYFKEHVLLQNRIELDKRIFIKEPIDTYLHALVAEILGISRESVRQTVENGHMNDIRRLQFVSSLLVD